jgi:hypothetical protein
MTYSNMNLIPDKTKKIQQENFRSYADMREWMSRNRFKNQGCVLEEPWKDFFVERWEKEGQVALTMNISFLPNFMEQPISIMEKPYQVDIAQVD